MKPYLCIHGHFYQPPRENPWLEAVEVEDSAAPYHDWNERITAECYAPNAAARILDADGRIARIVNNYARISFNFGPTLLAWMEGKAPDAYREVLAADAESRARFSGHGSALAQPYNHVILPLANRRDKRTQVLWGLADFAHRFGRPAEGAWLPEAAVDLESLDLLAEAGVLFTILEPHQARRWRPLAKAGKWHDGPVDTTRPYRVALPSGRTIAVFFYDGATSRAVAFEGLLSSGERFVGRLLSTVSGDADRGRPARLIHIATDGETYGHHHRYGEMALAWSLDHIEATGLARLTNYGELLAAHPPDHEAEIAEDTSWSCAHGVGRWREDCGCHTGGRPGWNQAWRAPLRQALDWLRDELAPRYEQAARAFFPDPWAARDGSVSLVLDRSAENVAAFLDRWCAGRPPQGPDRVRALKLLELQRHALLMYTSCGWFFNDLAGIETLQILRYAGRVAQLAGELFPDAPVEEPFLRRLARARSNDRAAGTGRDLYEKHVRPSMVDLPQVAAHYAVASLFEEFPNPAPVYSYTVEGESGRTLRAGRARLGIGRVRVTSARTGKTGRFVFGVLHLGDHNLNAGVKRLVEGNGSEDFAAEIGGAFEHGDLARVIRLLDRYFEDVPYSLKSLFRDEQRRVLDLILATTLAEVEEEYRDIFHHHAPLIRFLNSLGSPLPPTLRAAAGLVLNSDLKRAVAAPAADPEEIGRLLAETASLRVDLDTGALSFALGQALHDLGERLREDPERTDLLQRLDTVVTLARTPPLRVDLWQAQNRGYALLETVYPRLCDEAEGGDAAAAEWVGLFRTLAEKLSLRIG